jgi:tripartite-type tricarboxylate transporter receptor subunit TctC
MFSHRWGASSDLRSAACTRLCAVLLTLAASAVTATAEAQGRSASDSYPARPIRFIVPFPAGGFSDLLGRIVGQGIAETIGQPVVVENRPGASGNIGADAVAKAPPDGYTLLINSLNYVIGPNVMSMPFDTLSDFAPISQIASGPPSVMVVNPAAGYSAVRDVVARARANPGKLNIATAGAGTSTHLIGEMFRSRAGINAVLVPYKGGPAEFGSVASGEADVNFALVAAVLPLIQGGRLKPLAVTSSKRISLLPDVPTVAEAGLDGFEADNFIGLVAPAKTPRAVLDKLQREVATLIKKREFIERLERFGMMPVGSTPEEFDAFIKRELKKWADIAKAAGTTKGQ